MAGFLKGSSSYVRMEVHIEFTVKYRHKIFDNAQVRERCAQIFSEVAARTQIVIVDEPIAFKTIPAGSDTTCNTLPHDRVIYLRRQHTLFFKRSIQLLELFLEVLGLPLEQLCSLGDYVLGLEA